MSWRDFPQRHPIISGCFCFGVISFPQWFQSVWSLFRTDAPVPTIRGWLATVYITLPEFSPYWVTVPLGFGMFLWVAYELRLRPVAKTGQGRLNPQLDLSPATDTLDISGWVNHETYFVWVAACLWVNIKPIEVIGSGSPAYPALQKIKGAIESGQIKSLNGASNMTAKVHRAELLKLAAIHGEKPKFLFPVSNDEAEFEAAFKKASFERNEASIDAALLRLAELRTDGVAIRNEAEYVQDDSLQWWLDSVEKWMHEVIDVIWQVNEADSEWFKTLDTVPPPRVPITSLCKKQTNPGIHLNVYRQHDLRLVRLEQLLKKHGVAA